MKHFPSSDSLSIYRSNLPIQVKSSLWLYSICNHVNCLSRSPLSLVPISLQHRQWSNTGCHLATVIALHYTQLRSTVSYWFGAAPEASLQVFPNNLNLLLLINSHCPSGKICCIKHTERGKSAYPVKSCYGKESVTGACSSNITSNNWDWKRTNQNLLFLLSCYFILFNLYVILWPDLFK